MEQYEVVELKAALPQESLAAGAVGSIVHVFRVPETAYEVEFVDEDGRTVCTAALTPDRIRPAG